MPAIHHLSTLSQNVVRWPTNPLFSSVPQAKRTKQPRKRVCLEKLTPDVPCGRFLTVSCPYSVNGKFGTTLKTLRTDIGSGNYVLRKTNS